MLMAGESLTGMAYDVHAKAERDILFSCYGAEHVQNSHGAAPLVLACQWQQLLVRASICQGIRCMSLPILLAHCSIEAAKGFRFCW